MADVKKLPYIFKVSSICLAIFIGALISIAFSACETMSIYEKGEGRIVLKLNDKDYSKIKKNLKTKSSELNIDTNKFILAIYSSTGEKIYKGNYSDRPKDFTVEAGAYDIDIYSQKFDTPAFSKPVFGDSKTVVVSPGSTINVELLCKQINCGVKIIYSEVFKNKFPGNGLILSHLQGDLSYDYTENEYAFFNAGILEFIYNNGNTDTVLLTKQIEASQMLTCNLTFSESESVDFPIFEFSLDTTRVWISDEINIGLKKPDDAITLEEARNRVGEKGIKIFGYIVGGDVSSSVFNTTAPFSSNTHIVIADAKTERDRAKCFAVELPSGTIRNALNLVENSTLLGSALTVTGEVVATYFGHAGVKGTSEYLIIK